jgi:hypothetical protein
MTLVWIEHIRHALFWVVTWLVCRAEGHPRDLMAHPAVLRADLGSSPE